MRRKILSLTLAIFMLAAMAFSFSGCSESVDYVASVKQMAPYESSGVSTTYETVLSKYISSCQWQERVQSEELVYVDASGKITDTDGNEANIAITFKVTPYEGKTEGMLKMVPHVIEIDENSGTSEEASQFIGELFNAYDEGFDTYADYLAAYK